VETKLRNSTRIVQVPSSRTIVQEPWASVTVVVAGLNLRFGQRRGLGPSLSLAFSHQFLESRNYPIVMQINQTILYN
jgi:hypothetical protein